MAEMRYSATAFELEYGVRAWWTAELYLDGQTTENDSTLFTGFRIENRLRPFMREHWINPVLYVEYEDTSGADKTMLEVVGHDGEADFLDPNSVARQEHKHEGELKLILSSNLKSWNISENFIAEKNLGHQPWEFGYAWELRIHCAVPRLDTNARFAPIKSCWARKPMAAWEIPGALPCAIPLNIWPR